MAKYMMAIDPSRCTSCMACVMACKVNNQVPVSQSRNWVRSDLAEESASGYAYQPGACMQCADPLCVRACPTGATFASPDGVIQVDYDICIACGSCASACPYEARYIDAEARHIDKCDYCKGSLLPLGLEPACVGVCPTRARIFFETDAESPELPADLAASKLYYVESPESPTRPTLAYLSPLKDNAWPDAARIPAPIALMGPVAAASRWLGGLALFGVAAVALRQLVAPTEKDGGEHD